MSLFDAEIQRLEALVAASPRNQALLSTLGIHLQQAGRFAEAATTLMQAVENATDRLDCDSVEDFQVATLDRVATCHMKTGKFAEAAALWQTVLAKAKWSASSMNKVRVDLEAARAAAACRNIARKYGPCGQGAVGINRVLSRDESKRLEAESLVSNRADIVALVRSWGFAGEDATNLADDAISVVGKWR